MTTILITGANGFVGQYLIRGLLDSFGKDISIAATYFGDKPSLIQGVTWHQLEISKREDVLSLVTKVKPQAVIHLAAISHVPTANAEIEMTWQVNVLGSIHLFDAVMKYSPQCKIIYVGSSEVYGKSFQEHSNITEDACLQPLNVYATSKAAVDMLCLNYVAQGLQIIRLRPFNHIGKGQAKGFVIPAFASQIAAIENGTQSPVIKVGNLSAARDFLDVRDVVSAYITVLNKFDTIEAGTVINIASGVGYKINDLLMKLLSLSSTSISIEVDESRLRPVEIAIAIGNNDKAKQILDWAPKHQIEESLISVLDEWRKMEKI